MDQGFLPMLEKEVLEAKKLDGILVTSPANMRKCSGFRGEGLVYVSRDLKLVLTDSRYTVAAREECPQFEVALYKNNLYESWISLLIERFGTEQVSRLAIGFEDEFMTVQAERTIKALFQKYEITSITWLPLHKRLDRFRWIKSAQEIREIEQAEHIGDLAFAKIVQKLADVYGSGQTMTEKQIAAWIEFYMKELGAEQTSFDTIAASGIHSSMPHAIPTDRAPEDGEFLTMDFGCKVNGYCSDMTRTVVIGQGSEEQKRVYDIVLRAQETALSVIRPGIRGCEVDEAARKVISDAGYGDCFGHGLGHSVGLMIHERPCFSSKDETVLEPGMVITVEPGIYIEGAFGVRIEDLVVITEDGCRNLTHAPKEWKEIDIIE